MSEIDYTVIREPPCPMCGSPTTLKHRHRNPKFDGDTCVFKCTVCGVEYPMVVPAATPGSLPRTEA